MEQARSQDVQWPTKAAPHMCSQALGLLQPAFFRPSLDTLVLLRYRWKVGATLMPSAMPSSLLALLQFTLTKRTSVRSWLSLTSSG